MGGGMCRWCGQVSPVGDRYCVHCGRPFPPPRAPAPLGPGFTAFRFQIDPLQPAPRMDVRWVLIVLGTALTVAGALLLGVAALVGAVLASSAAGCAGSSCPAADPASWLAYLGLPLLGVGIVLLTLGVVWALR